MPIKDYQREKHLAKMAALKEQHGGKDCLCDSDGKCDYHAATDITSGLNLQKR